MFYLRHHLSGDGIMVPFDGDRKDEGGEDSEDCSVPLLFCFILSPPVTVAYKSALSEGCFSGWT